MRVVITAESSYATSSHEIIAAPRLLSMSFLTVSLRISAPSTSVSYDLQLLQLQIHAFVC